MEIWYCSFAGAEEFPWSEWGCLLYRFGSDGNIDITVKNFVYWHQGSIDLSQLGFFVTTSEAEGQLEVALSEVQMTVVAPSLDCHTGCLQRSTGGAAEHHALAARRAPVRSMPSTSSSCSRLMPSTRTRLPAAASRRSLPAWQIWSRSAPCPTRGASSSLPALPSLFPAVHAFSSGA